MSKKQPQTIYAARVNLAGLYSKEPFKCTWNSDNDSWWSSDLNVDVERLGIYMSDSLHPGYITFASVSKKEVELWLSGANSVMKMLASWAS